MGRSFSLSISPADLIDLDDFGMEFYLFFYMGVK
jgi:hypothetical protein